jgi:poly-beta-1,6-N-acetyl-D-glucosamine synthase
MTFAETLFWVCAGCVAYPYAVYPLAIGAASVLRPRPVRRAGRDGVSVSIVVAAHDEERVIDRRLRELRGLVESPGLSGEVIVVSDGSTDRTAAIARAHAGVNVRVIELPVNRGKAVALTEGCAAARSEVIAFADARQTWGADALHRLLENFSDPDVGAVSGELVLESAPGVMAGLGLYWRYEKWLRRNESSVHSMVGVTGAISAVRRELFRPIPPGTILDDVYWPLLVAMQGYRVVFDGRARAYDHLPERVHDEFRRKVRTLGGNFQLIARLPSVLVPFRNPIWVQFLSHKASRLLAPWALLGLLGVSLVLEGRVYRAALGAQLASYALGLAGLHGGVGARSRAAAAAASFLVLNAAAWLAFWVWITGGVSGSWRKAAYEAPPLETPDHP